MDTVSHQSPGSDVSMNGTSRTPRERREGDDIYQFHPIPNIPSHLSRPRPSEDSMLAYTERVRRMTKARTGPVETDAGGSSQTVLEIQAQHIPKTGPGQMNQGNRRPFQRRPLSLDELIGRRDKKNESSTTSVTKRGDRCMSEPVVVPKSNPTSSEPDKEKEKRIRINFVSTTDLFDLVDFNLRSKRSDNSHFARAEDTLRLIREVNFFRSMSNRRKKKSFAEKESELDRASLIVQGTSSPRESFGGDSVEADAKDGEWASYIDFDDEEDDSDDNKTDLDFDLLQDKRNMLLQPPKLLFRPKRAKRMKMHRSLLSAIPEVELAQRLEHQHLRSEDLSVRVPIIPSSSSLSAIKRSKHPDTLTPIIETGLKKSTESSMAKDYSEFAVSHSEIVAHKGSRTKKKKRQSRSVGNTENDPQTGELVHKEQADTFRENPSPSTKKKDTSGGINLSLKTSSMKGKSVLLPPSDPRQKKIRKIIFLRDQPEQ